MRNRTWQFSAFLTLLWAGLCVAQLVQPSQLGTCSSSNTSSIPQLVRSQVCTQAQVVGTGLSTAVAYSKSQAFSVKVAAESCGRAVSGAMGSLCQGSDPLAAVFAASTTCSAAMAATYVKSMTQAAVYDLTSKLKTTNTTKDGYLEACSSSCSNAQGTAEAFAQAAACGVTGATAQCVDALSYVQSSSFTRAFTRVAYSTWTTACARDKGRATADSVSMASALASSFAQTFSAMAVSICANCPDCKCKSSPILGNQAGDFSLASPILSAGKIGLAQAIASATSSYCNKAGQVQSARVGAQAIMTSFANIVGGALGVMQGRANKTGNAEACAGGDAYISIEAVKQASTGLFADASATVFNSWCPAASLKLSNITFFSGDTVKALVNRTRQYCTKAGDASGGFTQPLVAVLKDNPMLLKKVEDAMTTAKSCGCKQLQNLCFWCKPSQIVKSAPAPPPPPPVKRVLPRLPSLPRLPPLKPAPSTAPANKLFGSTAAPAAGAAANKRRAPLFG